MGVQSCVTCGGRVAAKGTHCPSCTVKEHTVQRDEAGKPSHYLDFNDNEVKKWPKTHSGAIIAPPEVMVPQSVQDKQRQKNVDTINKFRARRYKTNKADRKEKTASKKAKKSVESGQAPALQTMKDEAPVDKERIDNMTKSQRNPPLLKRAPGQDFKPGAGGVVLGKREITMGGDDENQKGTVLKTVSEITGIGTEQEALDCELVAQEATEDNIGRMWRETGAGKRIGTEPGTFAADVTIYKDVIPLIRKGSLGFSLDQTEKTIIRIKQTYPWAAGPNGEKYWLKPLFDSHKKAIVYQQGYRERKKAAKTTSKA